MYRMQVANIGVWDKILEIIEVQLVAQMSTYIPGTYLEQMDRRCSLRRLRIKQMYRIQACKVEKKKKKSIECSLQTFEY